MRHEEDRHEMTINGAVDYYGIMLLEMSALDIPEQDDRLIHQPMNISTGLFNDWGTALWPDCTKHRPHFTARSYAKNKSRR
jgi:hypothetical protein